MDTTESPIRHNLEVPYTEDRVMLQSIAGVYREGKVELSEVPADTEGEVPVIVTFLSQSSNIDLRTIGIDPQAAAQLRASFSTFADDWDSPEMSVYDDYNSAARTV